MQTPSFSYDGFQPVVYTHTHTAVIQRVAILGPDTFLLHAALSISMQ